MAQRGTPEDMHERLVKILVDQLGIEPGEAVRDAVIGEDLGADELDVIEITEQCEKLFGVSMPGGKGREAEPIALGTVGGFLDRLAGTERGLRIA